MSSPQAHTKAEATIYQIAEKAFPKRLAKELFSLSMQQINNN